VSDRLRKHEAWKHKSMEARKQCKPKNMELEREGGKNGEKN